MPIGALVKGAKALGRTSSNVDSVLDAALSAGQQTSVKLQTPVHFKDGSRLSGFTTPDRTVAYGYDKNGEAFTQRVEHIDLEGVNPSSGRQAHHERSVRELQSAKRLDPLDSVLDSVEARRPDPLDSVLNQVEVNPDVVQRTIKAVRTNRIDDDVARVRERADSVLGGSQGVDSRTALLGPESFAPVQNLSDLEIAAINFYTRKGDEVVNTALREGKVEAGSDLDQTIRFMNQTLDKLPPHQGTVYRGIKGDSFDDFVVGEEYSDPGFVSTTVEPLGVSFKDIQDKGALKPRRRTVLVVNSKSGRYIEPLTFVNFAGENEVLFKPGTRFRIVDKDPETKQVFLEEI